MRGFTLLSDTIFWQHVFDVERALKWYTAVLGLTRDEKQSYEGVHMLSVPLQDHVKIALTRSGFENPRTHGILDIQTSDVLEAHRVLKIKGADVEKVQNPAGNYHEFHVRDPEGYMIKIHGFIKNEELKNNQMNAETTVPRAKVYQSKDSIHIPVGVDLKAAAEWYMTCLELQGPLPSLDDASCTLAAPAGREPATVTLWRTEPSVGPIRMERRARNKTLTAITFNVHDIRKLQSALQETTGRHYAVNGSCAQEFQRMEFEDPYCNAFAALQEPDGWAEKIGRKKDAPFLDWTRIPVPAPFDRLVETGTWYGTYVTGKKASIMEEEEKCGVEGGIQLVLTDDGSQLHFERDGMTIPFVYIRTNDLAAMHRQLLEGGATIAKYTPNGADMMGKLIFVDPNDSHVGVAQA
ncbi:VOC family protein [Paenibacillus allorhizosphaerae]|uniref:VOC domain-containing protein n=1 Tax=Paenibacillus allorhizosphaerae TaxID=2849866 RepID=A0ABM8VTW3_9BACL|nr:VOC family protein [Paenibacillus allorhizosphaerae]CAG7658270.1 hypothetical protein PAECIP111802_07001 [Paenibacillus allorhizosphaerae]